MDKFPIKPFENRRDAAKASRILGCRAAHRVEGGWLPCESPEALDALVFRGVAAYRSITQEEKAILGRALSELGTGRNAATTGRRGRRVRRVAYDPNADDADGDKLVQEGTTAERSVGAKPAAAKPAAKPRKATPKAPTAAPVKPIEARRGPATRFQRAPLLNASNRLGPKDIVSRGPLATQLEAVDNDIVNAGGFGRWRAAGEGPLQSVVDRREEVIQSVHERFGELTDLASHEEALRKAFPNADIDLRSIRFSTTTNNVVESIDDAVPALSDEELGLFYAGTRAEVAIQAIKGFSYGVLRKAMDDEQTAARIGSIRLTDRDFDAPAVVGAGMENRMKAPILMAVNPRMIANDTAISTERALMESRALADELKDRDRLKKERSGDVSFVPALTNGDPTSTAMTFGFHEWAHAAGVASVMDETEISDEILDRAQQWVKDGAPFEGMEMFRNLDRLNQWVTDNIPDLATLDAEQNAGTLKWFESMGFRNVDTANAEQLTQMYRAMALRYANAVGVVNDAFSPEREMPMADWKKIDSLSGYANSDPEEAIAEYMAFRDLSPIFADAMFPEAPSIPAIQRRLP